MLQIGIEASFTCCPLVTVLREASFTVTSRTYCKIPNIMNQSKTHPVIRIAEAVLRIIAIAAHKHPATEMDRATVSNAAGAEAIIQRNRVSLICSPGQSCSRVLYVSLP